MFAHIPAIHGAPVPTLRVRIARLCLLVLGRRNFVFFYIVFLHLVVFSTLYYWVNSKTTCAPYDAAVAQVHRR